MTNQTLIHNVTPEQITRLFEGLQNQIRELKENFEPRQPTEYLTRNEVCEILKIDLSTLWAWTNKTKKLRAYGIGNRVYYKSTEIEGSVICLNKKGGSDE